MFTVVFQKLTFAIFSLGGSGGKNRGRKQFDPNKLGHEPKFRVNNYIIKNFSFVDYNLKMLSKYLNCDYSFKHSTFSSYFCIKNIMLEIRN